MDHLMLSSNVKTLDKRLKKKKTESLHYEKTFSLQSRVLAKLQSRCAESTLNNVEQWVSTREVAEASEMGIYQARRLLLKLVKAGIVIVTPTPVKNTLRWHLSDEAMKWLSTTIRG